MGLDQYAYARKGDENIEIAYWRKHANLQGWMEEVYTAYNGIGEFNCKDLSLSLDDIEELELHHRNLDEATGFFWGRSSDEKIERTQTFINDAKRYLRDGYDIIYSSWY